MGKLRKLSLLLIHNRCKTAEYRYVYEIRHRFHNFCDTFEAHNENDKNTVATLWVDCVSKKIVRHVPQNWSKVASKFLQFTNHHIRVKVTWKTVNRGVGLGLEIPVNYFLYGDTKIMTWVKNNLQKLDNELHVKVKECVK